MAGTENASYGSRVLGLVMLYQRQHRSADSIRRMLEAVSDVQTLNITPKIFAPNDRRMVVRDVL